MAGEILKKQHLKVIKIMINYKKANINKLLIITKHKMKT